MRDFRSKADKWQEYRTGRNFYQTDNVNKHITSNKKPTFKNTNGKHRDHKTPTRQGYIWNQRPEYMLQDNMTRDLAPTRHRYNMPSPISIYKAYDGFRTRNYYYYLR